MKPSMNKKKQSIERSILASPYDKFWPLLEHSDTNILSQLLTKLLPLAAIPKGFIKSKKLKQIYQERDKMKRKELWKQKNAVLDLSLVNSAKKNRKYLLLGVNGVTRGIEKKTMACCLISGDVSPRLMVNHIIIMAARNHIPVLVVPSLKEITRSSLGVPCLAFGLHECLLKEKGHDFYQLYEVITKFAQKFVVPDHLIISDNVIQDIVIDNVEVDEKNCEIDSTPNKSTTNNEFSYLHRSGTSRRTFIPPRVDVKIESDNVSFIPIKVNDEFESTYNYRRSRYRDNNGDDSYDEEDDDDDDNYTTNDDNFEILPDSDSLFCIDTKGISKTKEKKSLMKSVSNCNYLKSTIVKKVKSNPNKRKRKNMLK